MPHPSSPFALLVFCCIGTAAGFRAAHLALPVQQQSARCTPLQLCTTPPARRGSSRVARARPWLAAAVVAGSVVAMPTLALASATATGEHLHLGQKIALFFKRAPPTALPSARHLQVQRSGPTLKRRERMRQAPGCLTGRCSSSSQWRLQSSCAAACRCAALTPTLSLAVSLAPTLIPTLNLGLGGLGPPASSHTVASLLSCQVGNWLGLSPLTTFVICVVGNMLPILPTLLALRSDAVKKVSPP